MAKVIVNNLSAVGIIARAKDPSQIFIDLKDDGLPVKAFRRTLCPIGGNWVGDGAKNDVSPLDTFTRELKEEFSFERPTRDSLELSMLGIADRQFMTPAKGLSADVRPSDWDDLGVVRQSIIDNARPYADFLLTTSKSVIDLADPENKRDGFVTLSSYFDSYLDEVVWELLTGLYERFGNLSNESLSVMTSLDEIVASGTAFAYAHDQGMRHWFLGQGFEKANYLRIMPNAPFEHVGPPLKSYGAYLERYDVAKKPA
jgi:hypothetical protein